MVLRRSVCRPEKRAQPELRIVAIVNALAADIDRRHQRDVDALVL